MLASSKTDLMSSRSVSRGNTDRQSMYATRTDKLMPGLTVPLGDDQLSSASKGNLEDAISIKDRSPWITVTYNRTKALPMGSVSPATLEKLIKRNSSKRIANTRTNAERRGSQTNATKQSGSKSGQMNKEETKCGSN